MSRDFYTPFSLPVPVSAYSAHFYTFLIFFFCFPLLSLCCQWMSAAQIQLEITVFSLVLTSASFRRNSSAISLNLHRKWHFSRVNWSCSFWSSCRENLEIGIKTHAVFYRMQTDLKHTCVRIVDIIFIHKDFVELDGFRLLYRMCQSSGERKTGHVGVRAWESW